MAASTSTTTQLDTPAMFQSIPLKRIRMAGDLHRHAAINNNKNNVLKVYVGVSDSIFSLRGCFVELGRLVLLRVFQTSEGPLFCFSFISSWVLETIVDSNGQNWFWKLFWNSTFQGFCLGSLAASAWFRFEAFNGRRTCKAFRSSIETTVKVEFRVIAPGIPAEKSLAEGTRIETRMACVDSRWFWCQRGCRKIHIQSKKKI